MPPGGLTLAVLEATAGAGLAVFLTFLHARVAGEETLGLKQRAQVDVHGQQSAGKTVADGAGLAVGAAAADA